MINPNPDPSNNLVFYLGRDASTLKELGRRLQARHLSLSHFEHPAELSAAMPGGVPAVLILELEMVPRDAALASYLRTLLGGADPSPTLVCIAEGEGIEQRLQCVRAGANAFFLAPVDPAELAAKVLQVHDNSGHEPSRILIVEDEQSQAMYVAMLLTNAGMQVRTVSDPLAILSVLMDFRPDLILMDLYMPEASGAELTAIIRDHDQFYDLPILMVSNETDADKQIEAMLVGSDGFITKPVQRGHLIASIEHRIRMARGQRDRRAAIAKRGTPTGMLDKEYFIRTVERAVRDGSTGGPGAGILMVELDSPQQIMDRLGLSGIEKLLTHIERLLGRQLSGTDAAARYRDFTYAILARRKDYAALVGLGKQLQRIIAEPNADLGVTSVAMTSSIGIGPFQPPPDDALALLARAERSCAKARQNGGNRVEVWQPQEGRSEDGTRGLVKRALQSDGFVLLFQPIVALGQTGGLHYEAQLRLRAPDGELLPPREFFPVAERHGLMTAIDHWVMEYALDTLHDHRIRHPDLRLLVHQTMATVSSKGWLPWFREQLLRRGLKGIRPVLQFQMRDVRAVTEIAQVLFAVLRKAGVHICIANLTNSPSEIELIGRLGVTMVKLSIHTLVHTEIRELTDLVHHVHDQNALVVATGTEDQQTVTRVWNCRADFIQGNYIQMASEVISADISAQHGV